MAEGGVESSLQLEEGIPDEVRVPMCQLHTLPVEFYCQKHNTTLCNKCKLMEHRTCRLQDLEQAAVGFTGRNIEVLQQLREIETYMEKIGNVLVNEKAGLVSHEDAVIENVEENVEKKLKEIEALGQKKIVQIKHVFQQERGQLDRGAQALTQTKFMVGKSIQQLERIGHIGSEEEVFVVTKKTENDVTKLQDNLHDAAKVSRAVINFEADSKLTSIGKVTVARHNVNVDLIPEVTEVFNTQQCDNDKGVMWFDVLPGGQMILLSSNKTMDASQLSLYSVNKKLMSKFPLPEAASAVMLDNHRAVVPLPDLQQLQTVQIVNDTLTKGPVINTGAFPGLIQKYLDGSVLVLALTKPSWLKKKVKRIQFGDFYFQIIDLLTGKVEKQIKLKTDLQVPGFMKLSRERDALYIVDIHNGCYGFNLQGGVIFYYSHADYDDYGGLAVDRRGTLYFAAGKEGYKYFKCIMKLSPAGQLLKQLDIRAYPLQCIRNKMYVYGVNDQQKWVISYMYV